MKKRILLILTMCTTLFFCGCSKQEDGLSTVMKSQNQTGFDITENIDDMSVASSDSAHNESSKEKLVVKNNGGQYVKIGDKVYFRAYGDDAIAKISRTSNFRSEPTGQGTSKIMCYDTNTKLITEAFEDNGYGPIWYYDGRFYFQRYIAENNKKDMYSVDMNGKNRNNLARADILGAFDDKTGRSLYIYNKGETPTHVMVYEKEQKLSEITDPRWKKILFSWFDENSIVIVADEKENKTTSGVYKLGIDGSNIIRLGEIDKNVDEALEMKGTYLKNIRFDKVDDKYYMSVSYAQNMWSNCQLVIYEADKDKNESLHQTGIHIKSEKDMYVVFEDGKPLLKEHIPNSAWISLGKVEDVEYYFLYAMDENGEVHELFRLAGDCMFGIETAEVIDNVIFFVGNFMCVDIDQNGIIYTREETQFQSLRLDGQDEGLNYYMNWK